MEKLLLLLVLILNIPMLVLGETSISSVFNGQQLMNEVGLARTGAWKPENAVEFSGYGQIKNATVCLSSTTTDYMSWSICNKKSKYQIWSLKDDKLMNEIGLCAEVENISNSVLNPRLKLKKCEDKPLQKWKLHNS